MAKFRPTVLSEDPKALDGALEWADEEIKSIERAKEDSKRIAERIEPYRQEAIRKIKARKEATATVTA